MQEGKPLNPVEGLSYRYESQEPYDLAPEQQWTINSGCGLPPDEPSAHVKSRPQIYRFYDPSVQLEHVARKMDSVDSHSRRYDDVVVESQHGQKSAPEISRHSVGSLTRPSSMEFVTGPLPNPGRGRVDSRSAFNGYASLYEQQQSREDGASFEGEGIEAESHVESGVHGQPDGYAMRLAYHNQGAGNPPIGVEGRFKEYRPGFQEGWRAYHHSHEHAEHEAMLADNFANQSNEDSPWENGDQPFLNEIDNELDSGDLMYSHYDGLQQQNDDIVIGPGGSVVANGAVPHNFWHSASNLAPPRLVEASSNPQSQVDDPRLSHFWTPHKLY